MELKEVARRAWQEAKPGVNENFLNTSCTVVKHSKIILVISNLKKKESRQGGTQIVAFPKPQHTVDFEKANRLVRGKGPAQRLRGTIGSVVMHRTYYHPNQHFTIRYVQSHFTTGKENLPRGLATYYGGWRKRALREVFRMAKNENAIILVGFDTIRRGNYKVHGQLIKELTDLAAEQGVVVRESKV